MNRRVANLRPATAIGVWSIGALAVAAVAIAGDRMFFRAEPATAARMTLAGLTLWLTIIWPIASDGRLVRTFVVGQGAILLLIAAATGREGVETVAGWIAVCAIAFASALVAEQSERGRSVAWTALASLVLVGGAILLLRTPFEARW